MTVAAPDPRWVRAESVEKLRRLELPLPPPSLPLLWEPGDGVDVRPPSEIEGRAAILSVVLARCYWMSGEAAMAWLLDAHLLDSLTKPEWAFLSSGEGQHPSFTLHLEAVYALGWLLGLVPEINPTEPAPRGLEEKLPDLPGKETFSEWLRRANPSLAPSHEAATAVDLIYCLDWAFLEAQRRRVRLPGLIDDRVIGQRRWALQWAVVFRGPGQRPPAAWEDVDLSLDV